jgi:hypothetical protein
MTDRYRATPGQAASPNGDIPDSSIVRTRRRVRRRSLAKAAAATVAVVAAASGYVRPSVRPLQAPIAHAFSF